MRIHRIELNGFGPFAGREVVDFATLNEAGLFLLDGPTGAGKSTVLAGICFALYGTVPGGRTPESLASTQSPVGTRPEVLLDFTVQGRRFEVQRWPRYQRIAKRRRKGEEGIALTEEKAGAVLREHRDGDWAETSVRADEIGQLLRSVLSLDAQQFMRVVLLPQGEFAHFLRAESREKEALLRTLFGTGRFDGVERTLADRLKAVGTAVERDRDLVAAARQDLLGALQETLGADWWTVESSAEPAPPETWPDGELVTRSVAATEEAVAEGRRRRELAATALTGAQDAVEGLLRRRQDLAAAHAWQQRCTEHERRREQAEADRVALDRHRVAAPLARRAAEATRAAEEAVAAASAVEQAVDHALDHPLCRRWDEEEQDVPPAPAARFDALRQLAERDLDRLADREAEAERLTALEAAHARLQADITTLTGRAQEAEDSRLRLVEEHGVRRQRVEDLVAPAGGLDQARQEVEQAQARREGAHAHARDRRALSAAEDRLREATDQAQAAVDAWQLVVEQRLAGAASLLAAELEDGSPCAVCGSVDHPAPAAPGSAEIDAEAQDAARQEMETRNAARATAQDAVTAARATAEASALAAGGLTPEAADEAEERARQRLQAAQGAADDLVAARAALTRNEQDQQARAESVQALRGELAGAQTRLTGTTEELERLRQAVAAALGGRGDLAEVRRELEDARARITSVQAAQQQQATRATLAAGVRRQLEEELEASALATLEQAHEAVLPGEEEARRTGALREWEREEAALAELGAGASVVRGRALADQGATPPTQEEIAVHEAARREAEAERDAAAERSGTLQALHRQVTRQTGVLADVAERSAAQVAAYEETEGLLRLVRGAGENSYRMTLGSYVLAGRLEAVVAAATERLLGMTQGRYELRHDDSARGRGVRGLDITVLDRFTEDERPAATLSGGETFMASLALALGLADTVQAEAGGIDMDTLFVDEGFGSLDAETLADVMEVLDGLQAGGRTIGIVSHVERMRQDIGHRLEVQKTKQGSHLRVRVPDPA